MESPFIGTGRRGPGQCFSGGRVIVRRMSSGRCWGWVGRITMERSIEASECFGIMLVLLCLCNCVPICAHLLSCVAEMANERLARYISVALHHDSGIGINK